MESKAHAGRRRGQPVLWASLAASVALLACWALMSLAIEAMGEIVAILVLLALGAGWLAVLAWSLIHWVSSARGSGRRAWLPAAINLAAVAVLVFVPLGKWVDDADFWLNAQARDEVVQIVVSGHCPWPARPSPLNKSTFVQMPPAYRHLSRSGEILVYEREGATHIVFFTYKGILEDWAGFAYRSDGRPPLAPEGHLHGDDLHPERYREHWFWVAGMG